MNTCTSTPDYVITCPQCGETKVHRHSDVVSENKDDLRIVIKCKCENPECQHEWVEPA